MNTKVRNVLAIHSGHRQGDPGACEIYRVTTPLHYLNKASGWHCDWISFTDFWQRYMNRNNAEQTLKEIAKEYDLFVWARTSMYIKQAAFEGGAKTIDLLRSNGAKHIYEIDDDYTNEHRKVLNGDAMTFASWCDANTVTTKILGDTMSGYTKNPSHVLPNMLDPMLWKNGPHHRLSEDKIRILLSGSTTHEIDWKPLAGVLYRVARDYPNVQIVIGGIKPGHFEYLRGIPNAEYLPPVRYYQYIDIVKNADIVLAPVDPHDRFNDHKSPIKITEGQGAGRLLNGELAGAACIATNNAVYPLAIRNENVGLLVEHTSEAWEAAIRKLVENTELRHLIQREAYKFVWKKFNLETGWMEWARAYNKVLSSPKKHALINHAAALAAYRKSAGLPDGSSRQSEHIYSPVL